MSSRRLRPALDLVSDIGKIGFDLQQHSDESIMEAVALLRQVNPEMFSWLVKILGSQQAADAVARVDEKVTNGPRAHESSSLSSSSVRSAAVPLPPIYEAVGELLDVVERTSDHTEWFAAIAKLHTLCPHSHCESLHPFAGVPLPREQEKPTPVETFIADIARWMADEGVGNEAEVREELKRRWSVSHPRAHDGQA